jgi:hypothetical protein
MESAHDTGITIDGDLYYVRRDFDLIRRIEQTAGPLAEIDQKLRRCQFMGEDLVKLLRVALARQESRPPDDVIMDHIANEGIQSTCEQLNLLVMHLFAGHKAAVAWLQAEAQKTEGDTPPDPRPAA